MVAVPEVNEVGNNRPVGVLYSQMEVFQVKLELPDCDSNNNSKRLAPPMFKGALTATQVKYMIPFSSLISISPLERLGLTLS